MAVTYAQDVGPSRPGAGRPFSCPHLLGLRGLPRETLEDLLTTAAAFKSRTLHAPRALAGRTVATIFFEPSTRTSLSFELAAARLGGTVARFDVSHSSVQKGESLVDTVLTLEALGTDAIVLRHPASGAAHLVARTVRCAVVNAGDGAQEHPTQGLLDLLTIREVKGRIEGLRVALVGDIVYSRVARSALFGLKTLGASVVLCGPPTLVPAGLAGPGVEITSRLEEALRGADVVMALRMQKERQQGGEVPSLAEYRRLWGINAQRLALAGPDVLLLHPGPMNLGVEIQSDAAYGPHSMISTQVTNGVAVRMAVLYRLLGAAGVRASGAPADAAARAKAAASRNSEGQPEISGGPRAGDEVVRYSRRLKGR